MAKKNKKVKGEIEVPEGISVEIEGNLIRVKKDDKEIKRVFNTPSIDIKKKGSKIVIDSKKASKKEKKLIKTIAAHITNMIEGLGEVFVYKLEMGFLHFPISVSIDEAKKVVTIKNFLGETKTREAKILPNANVKVEGNIITISSFDKEAAGQTAANIERSTKIKNKDRRIFQDGIYIIEKAKGRRRKEEE